MSHSLLQRLSSTTYKWPCCLASRKPMNYPWMRDQSRKWFPDRGFLFSSLVFSAAGQSLSISVNLSGAPEVLLFPFRQGTWPFSHLKKKVRSSVRWLWHIQANFSQDALGMTEIRSSDLLEETYDFWAPSSIFCPLFLWHLRPFHIPSFFWDSTTTVSLHFPPPDPDFLIIKW